MPLNINRISICKSDILEHKQRQDCPDETLFLAHPGLRSFLVGTELFLLSLHVPVTCRGKGINIDTYVCSSGFSYGTISPVPGTRKVP